MAVIVLVHGVAQEQKSAETLEKDWLPALAGGLRIAEYPAVADRIWRAQGSKDEIQPRMAFYGQLFLQPGGQGDDPGEFTPEEESLSESLAREWLKRAAERASQPKEKQIASRELAYVDGAVGREVAGVGHAVGTVIKSVAKLPWFAPYGMGFAERFVTKALRQVTRYLTDEPIRTAALKSVLDLLGPETKVIIGHSLGSIVAFEAVHLAKRRLPLLLTIGSPLGLDTIVYPRLRPQPPGYPPQLHRWVNVADREDFIAAEPDLSSMFSSGKPLKAIFEGLHTVDNGAQPHNAEFYLTKIEVGRPVGQTFEN